MFAVLCHYQAHQEMFIEALVAYKHKGAFYAEGWDGITKM